MQTAPIHILKDRYIYSRFSFLFPEKRAIIYPSPQQYRTGGYRGRTVMKKYIAALTAVLMLLAPFAQAEGFVYSCASVSGYVQTSGMYDRFYAAGELSVPIPGLAEGLTPQGIAYLEEEDWLLFSGYRSDGKPSALIAVDRKTETVVKEVFLQDPDGRDYTGHAGGVCVTDTDIYVSNEAALHRLSLDTFRALPPSGSCRFDQVIPVPVRASFCSFDDGVLWVGEFQYGLDYPTDPGHKVKTADGRQKAWICGYRMEAGQDFAVPDMVLSITERIQGVTVRDGSIYLSQSYGRRNSSAVFRYDGVLSRQPDGEAETDGKKAPLWILDSTSLSDMLISPPMAECLCAVPEGICLLFESAAANYLGPDSGAHNPMDRVFMIRDF